MCVKQDMSNFNCVNLTCDPPCFLSKKQSRAKSNRIFLKKGRGDRFLILTNFKSPTAEVFYRKYYFFLFRLSSG